MTFWSGGRVKVLVASFCGLIHSSQAVGLCSLNPPYPNF